MPQSLSNIIIHIIFSTREREAIIRKEIDGNLHPYLAEVCKSHKCTPIKIGGSSDHVHIACYLGRTITIAQLVEELKKHGDACRRFYWQKGYGAFSIGQSQLDALINYISKQREHHQTKTFQEEFRAFLNKYDVHYDERYVWD